MRLPEGIYPDSRDLRVAFALLVFHFSAFAIDVAVVASAARTDALGWVLGRFPELLDRIPSADIELQGTPSGDLILLLVAAAVVAPFLVSRVESVADRPAVIAGAWGGVIRATGYLVLLVPIAVGAIGLYGSGFGLRPSSGDDRFFQVQWVLGLTVVLAIVLYWLLRELRIPRPLWPLVHVAGRAGPAGARAPQPLRPRRLPAGCRRDPPAPSSWLPTGSWSARCWS